MRTRRKRRRRRRREEGGKEEEGGGSAGEGGERGGARGGDRGGEGRDGGGGSGWRRGWRGFVVTPWFTGEAGHAWGLSYAHQHNVLTLPRGQAALDSGYSPDGPVFSSPDVAYITLRRTFHRLSRHRIRNKGPGGGGGGYAYFEVFPFMIRS